MGFVIPAPALPTATVHTLPAAYENHAATEEVVGTVRSTSQWFRNLAVDPDPAVWLGGRVRPAGASVKRGPVSLAVLELA